MSKTIEEKIKDLKSEISTLKTNSLTYKGYYQNDLNDLFTTGIYYTNSVSPTNAPTTSFTYATIICIYVNDFYSMQIAYLDSSNFYFRKYSGATPKWGSWTKFSTGS